MNKKEEGEERNGGTPEKKTERVKGKVKDEKWIKRQKKKKDV